MPTLTTQCNLFYFVHLDSDNRPIPGTMYSRINSRKLDHNYRCREALLPNTQMRVPAGKVQCFEKKHLRYFYRVNCKTGSIIPNSMFEMIGKPKNMYGVLEYIIWK